MFLPPFLSYPYICLAQGSSSRVSPPMISVLNICKSTRKILYNKSMKCLQILCVEGSAFSVPPSPTVTPVLGRSKGSAEQQRWKRSYSSMRVGFSTREKVQLSTRSRWICCAQHWSYTLQQRGREAQIPSYPLKTPT